MKTKHFIHLSSADSMVMEDMYANCNDCKPRITIRNDDDILNWFRDRAAAVGEGDHATLLPHPGV